MWEQPCSHHSSGNIFFSQWLAEGSCFLVYLLHRCCCLCRSHQFHLQWTQNLSSIFVRPLKSRYIGYWDLQNLPIFHWTLKFWPWSFPLLSYKFSYALKRMPIVNLSSILAHFLKCFALEEVTDNLVHHITRTRSPRYSLWFKFRSPKDKIKFIFQILSLLKPKLLHLSNFIREWKGKILCQHYYYQHNFDILLLWETVHCRTGCVFWLLWLLKSTLTQQTY